MNYKIIFFLILIFVTSCKQLDSKKIDYDNKFIFYSNKGFAIVYNDDLIKKNILSNKIDERSLVIFNSKLNEDTAVKITNLLNNKYLIAKVGKNKKFPLFYNSVISKRISKELDIDLIEPYVEIQTINSNKSFIANKAKTFDEEKNVANKAPIEEITIKNLNSSNENKKITKNKKNFSKSIKKREFNYIIKFADLYFEHSALDFKNRLTNEYKLKNVNIKKLSINSFRVYMGPYKSLKSIEKAFNTIDILDFDNIEIIKL